MRQDQVDELFADPASTSPSAWRPEAAKGDVMQGATIDSLSLEMDDTGS